MSKFTKFILQNEAGSGHKLTSAVYKGFASLNGTNPNLAAREVIRPFDATDDDPDSTGVLEPGRPPREDNALNENKTVKKLTLVVTAEGKQPSADFEIRIKSGPHAGGDIEKVTVTFGGIGTANGKYILSASPTV